MRRIHCAIGCELAEVNSIAAMLRDLCASLGFDEIDAYQVELAACEAMVNVIRHAYRNHAVAAPDEERERRLHRRDFERARLCEGVVRLKLAGRGIQYQLQCRQLRMNAQLCRVWILVGKLQLIGCVDLRIELDRLHRRSLQAQRLRAVAALRPDPLHLQTARERVRVVLEHDDSRNRAGIGIHQYDSGFKKAGRVGE